MGTNKQKQKFFNFGCCAPSLHKFFKMKIAILGAGMVGRAIAVDLAEEHEVTSIDVNNLNLSTVKEKNSNIQTIQKDLKDFYNYGKMLEPFDIVVTAVPGFMGFDTLKAVINAGKNVVDISFFSEDVLQLNELAKQKNITVITDCGLAPGMSNFIIGRYNSEVEITAFEIYVGGLPKVRKKPFEYKASFSPVDVIEEYIRPARIMENGFIVTKPALSERVWMHFDGLGTLDAFNTDGLRSLLYTMPHIKNQTEKTLRYPGHVDLILALKESGFFSTKSFVIGGAQISPLEFSSKILFDEWKLGPEEEDLTILTVILHALVEGKKKTIEYSVLDRYDAATKTSSMSRTTGYTCTAAVNLLAKNMFTEKGIFPPELVGSNKDCFDFVIGYLRERNVQWMKKEY